MHGARTILDKHAHSKRIASIILALSAALCLANCGGGGGSDGGGGEDTGAGGGDTGSDTGSGGTVTQIVISGKATFDLVPFNPLTDGLDYQNTTAEPIRDAVIQALSPAGDVLASSTTDRSGDFILPVPSDTDLFLRVLARSQRAGTASWDFSIVDNTSGGALYVLDGSLANSGDADSTRNIHAPSGWNGTSYSSPRSAAPFAILDALHVAFQRIVEVAPGTQFPVLSANWSERNLPLAGDWGLGQVGTTFYIFNDPASQFFDPNLPAGPNIVVLGAAGNDTDEYDRHVVIHEFGHYYEDQLARADSFGGEHGGGDRLDLRVAFSEGWGYGYAGIATDDPVSRDSSGTAQSQGFHIDVERNNNVSPGWYSEASVQSIIYDLYDAADDGVDALEMGFAPLHVALTGAHREAELMTSLFTFVTALKAANPEDVAAIDAIVAAQDVTAVNMDAAGSTETNTAGSDDVLPVYTEIAADGPIRNVCSIATFGTFNKLSNARLLLFDVPAAGTYRIVATGPAGSDPDIVLYRQGLPLNTADSAIDGSETLDSFVAAGVHVVEVYEYAYVAGDANGVKKACFDMRITAL